MGQEISAGTTAVDRGGTEVRGPVGAVGVVAAVRDHGHVHSGCRRSTSVNTKGVRGLPVSESLRSEGNVGYSRSVYPGQGPGITQNG